MEMSKTKQVVVGGLLAALVFVATFTIKIPIPFTQGYIHAGDSMIFLAALLFGWRFGALAGGIGSCLADLLGGYAAWALPSLVIKFMMGALVGWAAYRLGNSGKNSSKMIFVFSISLIWLGFIALLKSIMTTVSTINTQDLLQATDTQTLGQAMALVAKVDQQLLLAAVLLPAIMLLLAFLGQKLLHGQLSALQLIAMMAAGIWMVMGYYLAGALLVGNWLIPIFSIPWNVVQFIIGMVIAYLLYLPLKKLTL